VHLILGFECVFNGDRVVIIINGHVCLRVWRYSQQPENVILSINFIARDVAIAFKGQIHKRNIVRRGIIQLYACDHLPGNDTLHTGWAAWILYIQ